MWIQKGNVLFFYEKVSLFGFSENQKRPKIEGLSTKLRILGGFDDISAFHTLYMLQIISRGKYQIEPNLLGPV